MSDETEGEPTGPPPTFDWDLAFELMHKRGPEAATVIGLSMISEQLAFIAETKG